MKDSRQIPPLDAALRALLDSERAVPKQPAEVRARVMARARASLSQPAATPRRAAGWHVRASFAAAAALLLAVSAGAMAGIYSGRRAAPPTTPETAHQPPEPRKRAVVAPPSTPEPVAPDVAEAVAPTTRPHDPPRRAKATSHPSFDPESYEAEMTLLRQAQEQAARGGFEAALVALAEHARLFPTGRLLEEREALRIKALSKLERGAEACRAAEAFRRRFPRSVLSPRLSETCNPGD